MATRPRQLLLFPLFFFVILCHFLLLSQQCHALRGKWEVLKQSIGISAMHVALLPNGKVIAFDRTDFGASNISLPSYRCRDDARDRALSHDCSAHSVEFDPADLRVRPLTILTDTWCSSGSLTRDGVLMQTGGFNDGDRAVRFFRPCDDGGCDWSEDPAGLAARRWYATNQLLPDGQTMIVVGGRRQFNYEFVPKSSKSGETALFELPFLKETSDPGLENNLYPFLHLSPDGKLFVFANKKAILLDYANHRVVRQFPDIPGGTARNYPSTGSSALLPLLLSDSTTVAADVMVCGGAPPDANLKANMSVFVPASSTCGKLRITDESPEWEMLEMPMGRIMGDMILLPTGDVLVINGAGKGSAGWNMGRDPVLSPVLYHTGATHDADESTGKFEVLSPSATPRLYHSTAHLIPDGRVLVGGSNPNIRYEFTGVLFPTELSLEALSPPYLAAASRPRITSLPAKVGYGERMTVGFEIDGEGDGGGGGDARVTMVAPTFTTHSFSMNQRVLVLRSEGVKTAGSAAAGRYEVYGVVAPERGELAPAGYYLVFVVRGGVPSVGKWVRIQ